MARSTRIATVLALTISLLLATAACSSDDDHAGGGSTAAPSLVPPASETTVRTATSTTPTTTPAAPTPVGASDGAAAAQALYDAWVAGDRAAAARVAEPAAIDAIWAAAPGPYQLYRGCDTGEFDTGGCMFRDRSTNHTIQIDLTRRGDMWVVTGAFYSES